MGRQRKELLFAWNRKCLEEVLTDHGLASLGDSYINFVYSLALSNRRMKPEGTKAKGSILAEALRRAGLREHLPSRMSRHALADGAEALIVYAWLKNFLTTFDCVSILGKSDDSVDCLTRLLVAAKERITFP